MDSFFKNTSSMMGSMIKSRHRAYYFGKPCDPQSKCALKAREIFLLLDRVKNIREQKELIKEELWVILDHEKLLSEHNYCGLAKLTIYELLNFMTKQKAREEIFLFVEEIDREIDKYYVMEWKPHYSTDINIQALISKHLGNGIEYLRQKHESDKKKKNNSFIRE
jgi:hypothetical protein